MAREDQLTQRQKEWLEASRKIGRGAMTKSERLMLEKLYAEMLPQEQQELQAFIQKEYGQEKTTEDKKAEPAGDPTQRMEQREWVEPSAGLKKALGKAQRSRFSFNAEEQ